MHLISSWAGRACLSWYEHRASSQKVAKPWFDSRRGSTPLCPWKRCLRLLPILGQAVYHLLWWSSLTKAMQTEQLLCWSSMRDT